MTSDSVCYFDNASTSWPKPDGVAKAMISFVNDVGSNPGRAAHRRSIAAGHLVQDVREHICRLFNNHNPLNVVFCLNVTEALNLALRGFLKPGDNVVTSSMEHNSMMRPLRYLEKNGVLVTAVPCCQSGCVDPDDIKRAIMPATRMVAINHVSNVTGTIQPIQEIGRICREHGILFLLDTAQSAGLLDINMESAFVDLLAFTGHKSLHGPMGVGGLIVGEKVDVDNLTPLKFGGTGSRSASEEQPLFLPDLCEAGTPNVPGIAGLGAALEWIAQTGLQKIENRINLLMNRLLPGLIDIPEITLYGTDIDSKRTGIVSFTIAGVPNNSVASLLDERCAILCRVGLHCSPSSHKTIGTFPEGTVRFSLGWFNTEEEVKHSLLCIRDIAKKELR